MSPSDDATYAEGFALLARGDAASVERGLSHFARQTRERPADMKALFEQAGAFDFLGREVEALPLYERVLAAGLEELPEADRPRLFVQLGSTLRNLGHLDHSREILQEGVRRFPAYAALRLFLALTEHSSGRGAEALRALFALALENPIDESVREYARALGAYAAKIAGENAPERANQSANVHANERK